MIVKELAGTNHNVLALRQIFAADAIMSVSAGVGKDALIRQLVVGLAHTGRLPEKYAHDITETLLEREKLSTTGLGKGLALPHLRSRLVTDFVGAIGIAPVGVNFDSLDGLPTRLVMLLLSPFDQRAMHAEIMGRLAALMSNRTLQYAVQIPRTPEALYEFLGF